MSSMATSKRKIDENTISISDSDDELKKPKRSNKELHKEEEPTASANTNSSDDGSDQVFKILTWNIDGLEEDGITLRTKEVCRIILDKLADVVFLQELTIPNYMIILQELSEIYEVRLCNSPEGYFNGLLFLNKPGIELKEPVDAVYFATSSMGRHYLLQRLTIAGHSVIVMTSHFESLKDHAIERQKQLKECFGVMLRQPDESNVIFGGDLNLRAEDLKKIGGPPKPLIDAWEVSGENDKVKFTWDLKLNDNKQFDWGKPRARYDRVYFKGSSKNAIHCTDFQLVGTRRLTHKDCKMFPSDHFGILATFAFTYFKREKTL